MPQNDERPTDGRSKSGCRPLIPSQPQSIRSNHQRTVIYHASVAGSVQASAGYDLWQQNNVQSRTINNLLGSVAAAPNPCLDPQFFVPHALAMAGSPYRLLLHRGGDRSQEVYRSLSPPPKTLHHSSGSAPPGLRPSENRCNDDDSHGFVEINCLDGMVFDRQ